MIDEDRLQKALTYLATTDEPCAALRADMERAEYKAKAVKSTVFKHSQGSVADRNAIAETAEETSAAWDQFFDLSYKYEAMKNKRATEVIVIETWRSLNSNRRMGQV